MNRFTVLRLFLLFNFGLMQLQAMDEAEYTDALLHNQYLIENARLIDLAEKSYTEGKYDDAIEFATRAIQYAELSDEYVALQMKIKEASNAINTADAGRNQAEAIRTPERNAETYEKENLDEVRESAPHIPSVLADLPETPILPVLADLPKKPVLPAQYQVKSRDSLWNIAGKPEIYGDPWQWRRIYTANRNKLPQPDNPNLIRPGLILDIPSIADEIRAGIME